MITTVSWQLAIQELQKLVPGCNELLPDAVAEAAIKAGYSVQFVPLNGWEALTDDAILQTILPGEVSLQEGIIFVTDASFSKASPFSFQRSELHEFVKFHFAQYKECVVNGDVVIICPVSRTIVLFHHEGYHSTINAAH